MKINIIYIELKDKELYPIKGCEIFNNIFIIKEIDKNCKIGDVKYKAGDIVKTINKKTGRWNTRKVVVEKLNME